MRAVVVSDLHGDAITMGVARFAEIESSLWMAAKYAIEIKADKFICLGDVCDPDSGSRTFRVIRLLVAVAATLSDRGIDVIFLAGNHDVIEDGSGETTLEPLRGLYRDAGDIGNVFVIDRPSVGSFSSASTFGNFVALPFTATSHTYDPEKFVRENWPKDGSVIVLAHLGIEGIQPGEETTDMPRGRDVFLPLAEIQRHEPIMILSGHYHTPQYFKGVHVVGSLARLTASAKNDKPGYLVVEI
jgi:DNA repair exonuclease SbcCD nuclease subunit